MVYTNIRALDQPYKKAVVVGKKYYWLKVSEHFFEDEKIKYLESQENGEKYVYFWIKLLLKCLKTKDENEYGFLRFSKKIPYNDKLLSDFTGTDIDTVRVALSVFKKLEMIEILDDETIYIESVQEMIGSETEGAARVRRHRNKIALLSNNPVTDSKHYKRREEKEIEKEIEIEEEKKSSAFIFHNIDFEYLLSFWLECKLMNHKISTVKKYIKKKHSDLITDTGFEETKTAIKNYSIVLHSDKYYWTHEWSLWDFIGRGLHRFVDSANPLKNFLKFSQGKPDKKTDSYFDENKDLYDGLGE